MLYRVRRWITGEPKDEQLQKRLEQLRQKSHVPVFWLFGKTQSGKTSLIKYLTGADEAEIYKLQKSDGAIVAKIVLDKANDPSVHDLDIKDGVLWYCDANKGWVCNLT